MQGLHDSHAKAKDFWTHAVVFTSKDQNLNKAHVQRLEARLVELAATAKRCELDNIQTPTPPSLSEADIAEVEGFLDDILLCLPTLGFSFFERREPNASARVHALRLKGRGIVAYGSESADGFIVLEGSQAAKSETGSCHSFLRDLRTELVRKGVLREDGKHLTLTQDYTFGSPSTAAGVMLGRNSNGRVDWKTEDGKTLKSVQEEGVGDAVSTSE